MERQVTNKAHTRYLEYVIYAPLSFYRREIFGSYYSKVTKLF